MDDKRIKILQGDITECKVDVIVNAANPSLLGGGGVDGAIHHTAGYKLLEECRTLGGCKTGEAKITKGYNLPAKHVIHTVGPIWYGGNKNEKDLLVSCYKNSMNIAIQKGFQSIVFPLISGGAYGYPVDEAIKVALETLQPYTGNGIEIALILYDMPTYIKALEIYDRI